MDSKDLIHKTLGELRTYHGLLLAAIEAVEAAARHAPNLTGHAGRRPQRGQTADAMN